MILMRKRTSNMHAYHNRSGITFPFVRFHSQYSNVSTGGWYHLFFFFFFFRLLNLFTCEYIIFNKFSAMSSSLCPTCSCSHFIAKNIWAMPLHRLFPIAITCVYFVHKVPKYLGRWQKIRVTTVSTCTILIKCCANFFRLLFGKIHIHTHAYGHKVEPIASIKKRSYIRIYEQNIYNMTKLSKIKRTMYDIFADN